MNLLNYIKGNRKGKNANRIEKKSMRDSFLLEALEGFDSVKGNHADAINRLKKQIASKSSQRKRQLPIWQYGVAASILIFILGGYLLIDNHKTNLLASEVPAYQGIIDIYVPEKFYEENIVIIAKNNVASVKKHSPNINISRFTFDEKDSPKLMEAEVFAQSSQPIDIYVPAELSKSKIAKEPVIIAQHRTITPNETAIKAGYVEMLFNKQAKTESEAVIIDYGDTAEEISQSKTTSHPQPLIGMERYNSYLKNSLQRPTDDICKDKHGRVVVEFSIDKNGKPINFHIKQSLCGTADKEAVRLILMGSRWHLSDQRATVKVQF